MSRIVALLAICLAVGSAAAIAAQPAPAAIQAEPSDQSAIVTFFNRPIVVLRARALGRGPVERAEAAGHALDDLAARDVTGPVEWHAFDTGALITVASRGVLILTPPDVDELSGDTVAEVAERTAERLRQAIGDASAARTPAALLRASAASAVAIAFAALALWWMTRARRAVGQQILEIAERTVARTGLADVETVRASPLPAVERGALTALSIVLDLFVIYATIGFVLRQFLYTRPWGQAMGGFLVTTAMNLGLGVADAIPGLVTAVIIFLLARFVVRLLTLWFTAVERGRLTPRWIFPETAQPTRRLTTGLVWIFAVVVAYPYLPGSQTDAFKGASVFLGLMVTFGSSGIVNQIMSGFMITYSRALRVGDFVRVGEVEGTVIHLGVLSTKVRTLWQEEVTIPNAVVVAQTTTDYSRTNETGGVFTPTSVTIGYDAPWRQVQALLLLAAQRTAGVRREPPPVVLQAALEDFYVKYTLLVCLERQQMRLIVLAELHANIQDLFNEHGVQIMSPNYVFDPASPKIVAKHDWFAAPAEVGVAQAGK